LSSAEPTDRRRKLATLLKQLRIDSGMSAQELGDAVGWSQSKVSKIENGRTRPALPDVKLWVERCGATPALSAEIVQLASLLGTEATSWRDANRGGAAAGQRIRAADQSAATSIAVYQSEVVPGLLQTPDYARRLLAVHSRIPPEEVPAAVVARLDRQAAVLFSETAIDFVITETALRWQPGTAATSLAQLDRVAALDSLPNVSIGIISLAAQAHARPLHSFVIVRSDDDVEAQVETLTAELVIREPDDVVAYEEFFADQRSHAVYGAKMTELVRQIAEQIKAESSRT
jgi:transcriptional regulator with XRE-family HTH domain